nr:zinc finger, CCHC-type [Tanacetum cinerariifolium]
MFVIEQPIPSVPAADSEVNMLAEWNAIYDAYNEVACLMLGSMTTELYRQFGNYSSYDMLQELKSMFEKQAGVERFDLIQTFHACKEEEGKPVGAYIIKMKDYVEQLEHLGYVLPQDLSVGLILNCLTSDFARFVRNYNMHNIGKIIGEIHALLIKCEKGYLKRLKHHKKRSKFALPVLQRFREARKLKQGALYLYVGNGVRAQVEAIGSFDLVLSNGLVICLDNCHYASSITRGVVLVHRLEEEKNVIRTVRPFAIGKLPLRYLGVPLIAKRLGVKECGCLLDKIKCKISNWKNKYLSYARRLQLIDTVLESINVYWASVFLLPTTIIKEINRLLKNFLWNQVHTVKLRGMSTWKVSVENEDSWGSKNLLSIRDIIKPNVIYQMGNGINTSLWFDNWSSIGPLFQYITHKDLYDERLNAYLKVKDMIRNGDWLWPRDCKCLLFIDEKRSEEEVYKSIIEVVKNRLFGLLVKDNQAVRKMGSKWMVSCKRYCEIKPVEHSS